jgi:site-specific DNA-cytosine methylase
MVEWLQKHRPVVHLWENVPDLLAPGSNDNLEWLLGILFKIGYVVAYGLFKSSSFGHPTHRERAYGVCIRFESVLMPIPCATALAQRILDVARSMIIEQEPKLRDFLLPRKHEHLKSALQGLQRVKAKGLEGKVAESVWRKKTLAMCDSAHLNYCRLQTPSFLMDSPFFQSLPLRGVLIGIDRGIAHCVRGVCSGPHTQHAHVFVCTQLEFPQSTQPGQEQLPGTPHLLAQVFTGSIG